MSINCLKYVVYRRPKLISHDVKLEHLNKPHRNEMIKEILFAFVDRQMSCLRVD